MSACGQTGRDKLESVNGSRSQKAAQRVLLGLSRRRYLIAVVIGVVCYVTRPTAAAEGNSLSAPLLQPEL